MVQLFYPCCEVWVRSENPLALCWVCRGPEAAIRLTDLPDFHPWTKIQYLNNKQSATRPYL